MKDKKIKSGDIIYFGIPSVALSSVEFLAYTSDNNILHWNNEKTKALKFNLDFYYYDKQGKFQLKR